MESTSRLALPLIIPGQAQKELVHNEALQKLDTLVAGAVEHLPANDPPESPFEGACYLIGDDPSGEWSSYPGHVAAFSAAGWRFVAPCTGMTLTVTPDCLLATYDEDGWEIGAVRGEYVSVRGTKVVGSQAAAIPNPEGGDIIDSQARTTLTEILSALRLHGLIAQE